MVWIVMLHPVPSATTFVWSIIHPISYFESSSNLPDTMIKSLAPGRFQWNLRKIISKLILGTDGCHISSEIALRWTSLDLSDDKSTLVEVMAWCRQATSHYLSQCWPSSMSPYGVTRPLLSAKYKCVIFSSETNCWLSIIRANTRYATKNTIRWYVNLNRLRFKNHTLSC